MAATKQARVKSTTAWFVVDMDGEIVADSCASDRETAIRRFSYPALKWEAFEESGWTCQELRISKSR